MPIDNLLKAFGWILDLVNHGISHISNFDDIRIGFILSLSFNRALFGIEPWLIEVKIFAHCDALSRNEELQESGYLGIPVFAGLTSPSAQQG